MNKYLLNLSKIIEVCRIRLKDADLKARAASEREIAVEKREKAVEEREKTSIEQKKLIDEERRLLIEEKNEWMSIKERIESDIAAAAESIEMNIRGTTRWASKSDILRFGNSYFRGLMTFNPTRNGQYMINR